MIRAAVVGASGYTGAELVRLLSSHPEVSVEAATSESFAGQTLSELYPALHHAGEIKLQKLDDLTLSPDAYDVVFLGVPHGESMNVTPKLLETGVKLIDLSGDFRFHDTAIYEKWYKKEHVAKELAARAVYGLPELFRDEIKKSNFVANPGCYVTATVLALYPLIKSGLIDAKTIIADAKSGISGAGRKAVPATMFNRISENIIPYKVGGQHQHTPEMESVLKTATAKETIISFTPQMISARRGILTTVYSRLTQAKTSEEITALYESYYGGETFVKVQKENEPWPDLAMVVGSNSCVLKTKVDQRTGMVITVAVIDNLIKGASGQAIQNMNLLFGMDESAGLPTLGMVP